MLRDLVRTNAQLTEMLQRALQTQAAPPAAAPQSSSDDCPDCPDCCDCCDCPDCPDCCDCCDCPDCYADDGSAAFLFAVLGILFIAWLLAGGRLG